MQNRIIKFRAWDIIEKEYVYEPIDFELRRLDRAVIIEKQWIGYHAQESFIMEQFTGLLDKHGKEIYEGDIYIDTWNQESIIEYKQNDDRETVGHGQTERYITSGFVLRFVPDEIEIIGNIHSGVANEKHP